jgi:hypothetical protein
MRYCGITVFRNASRKGKVSAHGTDVRVFTRCTARSCEEPREQEELRLHKVALWDQTRASLFPRGH